MQTNPRPGELGLIRSIFKSAIVVYSQNFRRPRDIPKAVGQLETSYEYETCKVILVEAKPLKAGFDVRVFAGFAV